MESSSGKPLGVPLSNPIVIISQNSVNVTFNLVQTFKNKTNDSISWMSVYYQDPTRYDCPKTNEVEWQQQLGPYVATCQNGFAEVTLYVHDGSFGTIGTDITDNIPEICNASSDRGKKVSFRLRLPCTYDENYCTDPFLYV
jgi:hypothetical protein